MRLSGDCWSIWQCVGACAMRTPLPHSIRLLVRERDRPHSPSRSVAIGSRHSGHPILAIATSSADAPAAQALQGR
jgi:hypothetical protein